MPIIVDDRGLIPPGVHEATLEEVDALFARFQRSDRRMKLFGKLREYLNAVKNAQCGVAVILDGSFVMACVDEPEDIDLILILPEDWDMGADLKPYQYNLVSKRRVRKEYKLDMVAAPLGSDHEQEWVLFFQRVNVKWCRQFGWPDASTKGIVRVEL